MVNGQRPSAMTAKGSAGATSVQPAGRENNSPFSSCRWNSVLTPVLAVRDELEVQAEQRVEPVRYPYTSVLIIQTVCC